MKLKTAFALFLTAVSAAVLGAIAGVAYARGTDVKVETKDLDLVLNQKRESEEKFSIPVDEATEVGFTEDGDPAVRRHF